MTLNEYITKNGAGRRLLGALQSQLPELMAELPPGAAFSSSDVQIVGGRLRILSYTITDEVQAIECYGRILAEALERAPFQPRMLRRVSNNCLDHQYNTVAELLTDIEKRTTRPLFKILVAILIGALILLAWLYNRA